MDWFYKFPHMDDGALRNLKKAIDDGFRGFTRQYGEAICWRYVCLLIPSIDPDTQIRVQA